MSRYIAAVSCIGFLLGSLGLAQESERPKGLAALCHSLKDNPRAEFRVYFDGGDRCLLGENTEQPLASNAKIVTAVVALKSAGSKKARALNRARPFDPKLRWQQTGQSG